MVRYIKFQVVSTLPTPSESYKDVYLSLTGSPENVYFCTKGEDNTFKFINIATGEVA